MRKALFGSISCCALNLIVVVVEASNVGATEFADLTGWATNTTAYVENLHVVAYAHGVRKVMFMARNSLVESLAVCEAAEVERLSPSILVEVGAQIVITDARQLVGAPNCQESNSYCLVRVAYSAFRA